MDVEQDRIKSACGARDAGVAGSVRQSRGGQDYGAVGAAQAVLVALLREPPRSSSYSPEPSSEGEGEASASFNALTSPVAAPSSGCREMLMRVMMLRTCSVTASLPRETAASVRYLSAHEADGQGREACIARGTAAAGPVLCYRHPPMPPSWTSS